MGQKVTVLARAAAEFQNGFASRLAQQVKGVFEREAGVGRRVHVAGDI
jgi:hypothetical protein